jgi:hypothetical protein
MNLSSSEKHVLLTINNLYDIVFFGLEIRKK